MRAHRVTGGGSAARSDTRTLRERKHVNEHVEERRGPHSGHVISRTNQHTALTHTREGKKK